MITSLIMQLENARKTAGLSQEGLARHAGLSRMTVQRTEAGDIDPRLSTVLELARALGMELVLVPGALRAEVEDFLRSGGRFLGQPAGAGAPPSVVDTLAGAQRPAHAKP